VLQRTRGWSDDAWAAAVEGLAARGVVAVDGSLTDDGAAQRAWVEERTDALAAAPWEALGDDGCAALMATGKALSRALMAADAFSRSLP
jgi:hypothetical protein